MTSPQPDNFTLMGLLFSTLVICAPPMSAMSSPIKVLFSTWIAIVGIYFGAAIVEVVRQTIDRRRALADKRP